MKYYWPALLWSILIFVLSAGPGVQVPSSWMDLISVDKFGHAGVYGILTILICWGSWKKRTALTNALLLFGLTISSTFGIIMEGMQYFFFPHRYFEVLDIIANIIGSLIGLLLFYLFYKTD